MYQIFNVLGYSTDNQLYIILFVCKCVIDSV